MPRYQLVTSYRRKRRFDEWELSQSARKRRRASNKKALSLGKVKGLLGAEKLNAFAGKLNLSSSYYSESETKKEGVTHLFSKHNQLT